MPFRLGKSEKRPEKDPEGPEGTPSADLDEHAEDGDHPVAASPTDDSRMGESAPFRPMEFRPSFLDNGEPGEAAAATTPAAQVPEGDAFFVSVTQDGDSQVHRFDDPAAARAFVEEVLEKGVPEENVTAFSGRKLALKVTHRPIVKLVSAQED